MTAQQEVREAAFAAHEAGLCVVPPREDGTKRPLPDEWKPYQLQRSTLAELERWYSDGRSGLGLVCGQVSGDIEGLDFDDMETYDAYAKAAREVGLGPLMDRIEAGYSEATPKGRHWLYRCADSGNTKLARRPTREDERKDPDDKVKTLIETKGDRGYLVLAPTNGKVHESGKPYRLLAGSFATIATITPEERSELHELAQTFDQMPRRTKEEAQPSSDSTAAGRPGDEYNQRVSWPDVLEPHGWQLVHEADGTTYWRRPGKKEGSSATTNHAGSDLLYVFSTSTLFESERGYSKFAAYTELNHAGDFAAAAKELAGLGYGEEESGPSPSFSAKPLDEVLAEPLDSYDQDVVIGDGEEGALVSRDGKAAFAGPTGAGKTNILLHESRCLAEASPFLGLPVPRPRTVLYTLLEGSRRNMRRRLHKAWAGSDREARRRFHVFEPDHLDLTQKKHLEQLDFLLFQIRPDVLIIDAFRYAHPLDENSNTEMPKVTAILDGIIRRHGCAIILAHHDRKRPPLTKRDRGIDSVRGASAFTGWLSACITIDVDPTSPDSLLIEFPKTRDAEVVLAPLSLDFDRETLSFAIAERAAGGKVPDDVTPSLRPSSTRAGASADQTSLQASSKAQASVSAGCGSDYASSWRTVG